MVAEKWIDGGRGILKAWCNGGEMVAPDLKRECKGRSHAGPNGGRKGLWCCSRSFCIFFYFSLY